MNSEKKVEQKIDYIHNNEDYQRSSESFYLEGDKIHSFITDYKDYFG
jgi:putative transposase